MDEVRYERAENGTIIRLLVGGTTNREKLTILAAQLRDRVSRLANIRSLSKEDVQEVVVVLQANKSLFDSKQMTWEDIVNKAILSDNGHIAAIDWILREET